MEIDTPPVSGAGRWIHLLQGGGSLTAAVTTGDKYFATNGGAVVVSGGTAPTIPPVSMYIAAADFPAVGALTAKLRIRFMLYTNDVAPTGNFTVGLYPITRPATSGGVGAIIFTLGTVVASSTGLITAPAVDSMNTAVSAEFAVPADGYYALGVINSATTAASSHVGMLAILQTRYS